MRELALLGAAVQDKGTILDIQAGDPGERAELLRTGRVQAAFIAVPPDGADWRVPLGTASSSGSSLRSLRIEDLRPGRGERSPRRILIQPEDDVPHIRDPLQRLGHRAALLPAQITVAASLIAAISEVMRAGEFLLCSAVQAAELGLAWRPLASPVTRGYSLSALPGADAEQVRTGLEPYAARLLGVPAGTGERAEGKQS